MARLNQTIENALIAWVRNNTTGLSKVIWDKQRAKDPTLPYATLNLLAPISENGIHAVRTRTALDTYTAVFRFLIPVSINIYTNNDTPYIMKMNELFMSLDDDSVLEDLKTAGLAFSGASEIRDLTALVDTDYEFRIQQDFDFRYSTTSEVTAREIQTVIADIKDNNNNIEINVNVTK